MLDNSEFQGSTFVNLNGKKVQSDLYITNQKVDFISADFLSGQVSKGSDFVSFSVLHDGNNLINHLNGPVSQGIRNG